MPRKLPTLDEYEEIDDDFNDDGVFDDEDFTPDTEGEFNRFDDYPQDEEIDWETPLYRRKL